MTVVNISPATLQAAANEARAALDNGWQEAIDCPHCTNGSVIHHGSMSWQTRSLRCHYCRGTGRVYRQATSGQQPGSDAGSAEPGGSGRGSSNPARNVVTLRQAISPASREQRLKVKDAQCLNCGHPGCDPAHLTSRAQGGCDSPLCVVPLCRSCHRGFDDGLIDLEPILALREHRLERGHMAEHLSLRQCIRRLNGRAA